MKSFSSSSPPTAAQSASLDHLPGVAHEPVPVSVPLLDLRRQYDGLRDEMLAAIARVCDSQSYILGPEVEALEREIGELTGAGHAVGCASGTEALWLALVAAGVKPGDAVITTALSFFASASAIVRAGATPVFVDVRSGNAESRSGAGGADLARMEGPCQNVRRHPGRRDSGHTSRTSLWPVR